MSDLATLTRLVSELSGRVDDLSARIPVRIGSRPEFRTNLWTVIGGKQLGYSGLYGATAETVLPDDLPEYDLDTRPATADGVGYIRSIDTGEVALLWNGPPGQVFRDMWEGLMICCLDKITIPITDSDPVQTQTFYLCNLWL